MNKVAYVPPQMEVMIFQAEDIVTASGGDNYFQWSDDWGSGNGNAQGVNFQ